MSDPIDMRLMQRLAALEKKVSKLYEHAGLAEPDAEQQARQDLPPKVAEAIAAGNKTEAIQAHREATGSDLATAKQAVEALGG
jgi:ribosomal protein L7/L12